MKTLEWNDLELGTVVDLDSLSKPIDAGSKRSRVRFLEFYVNADMSVMEYRIKQTVINQDLPWSSCRATCTRDHFQLSMTTPSHD